MLMLRRDRPKKLPIAEAGKEHRHDQKPDIAETSGEFLEAKSVLEEPDANGDADRDECDSRKPEHQPNAIRWMKLIVTPKEIQATSI